MAVNGKQPEKREFRQARDFMPTIWPTPEVEMTDDEVRQAELDNRARSKALMMAAAGPVRG